MKHWHSVVYRPFIQVRWSFDCSVFVWWTSYTMHSPSTPVLFSSGQLSHSLAETSLSSHFYFKSNESFLKFFEGLTFLEIIFIYHCVSVQHSENSVHWTLYLLGFQIDRGWLRETTQFCCLVHSLPFAVAFLTWGYKRAGTDPSVTRWSIWRHTVFTIRPATLQL